MRLFLLVSVAIAPCSPVRSADPQAPETRAHEIACELADTVGPRLAGSEGDRRGREWAIAKMKALGLANVREEKFPVPHWERGLETAEITAPVRQRLVIAALGHSVSTPAGGIEAEVVRMTSVEEVEKLPEGALRGKIVFYDRAMTRGPRSWNSYGDAVSVRGLGAAAAHKKGAVASVIRSIGTSQARFPHTGAQRMVDGKPPAIPAGALAIPDAELLARLLAKGPVRLKLVLESRSSGETESANVIGEITGSGAPGEIVLLGAHLDSWDLGTGAIDDATGVGVVLEVARFVKANPVRRTVRVVLFGSEESGIRGAFAYAKAHEAELAKHHAALEIDGSSGPALDFLWWSAPSADASLRRVGAALAPLAIASSRSEDAGGADLIPLGLAGVPKLDLMLDATRYFDLHHTADDTCDKLEPAKLAQVTEAAHVIVRKVADEPALFERAVPPSR